MRVSPEIAGSISTDPGDQPSEGSGVSDNTGVRVKSLKKAAIAQPGKVVTVPRRDDLGKVLIIGSGPIVIGQACEFDYSGTQACKALRTLGYQIVLVNSNPATIMTDPVVADMTYIEPLTVESLTKIIEKERPDALLPNLGGQTGLNLSSELAKQGVLKKYNIEIIGVPLEAIERGEDREAFKATMNRLGIEMPRSEIIHTLEEGLEIVGKLGLPVVVRPAYTMGGTGGGLVYNMDEFRDVVSRGLAASRIGQCLVEESIEGWEELELEVVRDANNNMITVCFIENVDAVGVHTGDSYCTAPMLTISPELQQRLQEYSYAVVESIGVIGGTNVQFAYNPKTDRVVIIEINPRTSRSSALASKATGFPIALVSAKLAGGLTMKELPYWRGETLADYTPYGDYVVVKFARWAFEKFPGLVDRLGTQMRAVGEVMSIGRNYKEAFQKAIRSLEIGCHGLGAKKSLKTKSLDELLAMLAYPTSQRQFVLYEAIRNGAELDDLYRRTHIKRWFLEQMKELVDLEEELLKYKGRFTEMPDELLATAKRDGFADRYMAWLLETSESTIRARRFALGVVAKFQPVNVSGVEKGAYYYSTYNADTEPAANIAPNTTDRKKVMVLGGGPNRIGQGIEFDYCCVHAAFALRDMGYESIMVNCNPETVSTDYDTSDRLYFEPLTVEDILAIYEKEKPDGVIVQFGGQTPLNLAKELEAAGVKILGTTPDTIDRAEDRERWNEIVLKLGIPQPEAGMAHDPEEAVDVAQRIGYPVMVRPSFVLGGRAMQVVYDDEMLREYMRRAVDVSPERPILIDQYLENATEAEADAISDGVDAFVPAVMEHIEQAGVHSGDSACVIPPVSIPARHIETMVEYTRRLAVELGVVGLMNVQYAIFRDRVYILEANPRASRTVPLVSKVCNIQMARLGTQCMMGRRLAEFSLESRPIPHYGVKEAVFPFNMYHEVDPILGPEMRSTGEVLGMSESFGLAFAKAEDAAGGALPMSGCVLITVADPDKDAVVDVARGFAELGFSILATGGTHDRLTKENIPCTRVNKISEGRPNILDSLRNGEVQILINTPLGKSEAKDDAEIRRTAIRRNIPYMTTIAAAVAAVRGIAAMRSDTATLRSLQEYHERLR